MSEEELKKIEKLLSDKDKSKSKSSIADILDCIEQIKKDCV